jgi:hypothetical protein
VSGARCGPPAADTADVSTRRITAITAGQPAASALSSLLSASRWPRTSTYVIGASMQAPASFPPTGWYTPLRFPHTYFGRERRVPVLPATGT